MTENLVYAVQLKKWIIDNGYDLQAFRDLFALVSAEISGNPDFNHDLTFEVTASLKNWLAEYMQVSPEREIEECAKLMESCLLLEAPYLVDSYFQYIELDIPDPYKRFYLPRRRVLRPIIDAYQEVYDGKLDFLSVSQPKRTGKCILATETVWTPVGKRQMRDLKVGDYVIGANGVPTKVLGVYPQKEKKRIYEIEFTETGKSKQVTVVECCKDHLWEVSTEDSRYKHKPARIMTTLELMGGTLKRGKDKHNNYAVEYVKPVEFAEKPVLIDPWLVGVLIGDGGLSGGNIMVSNTEPDIVGRIKSISERYGCAVSTYDDVTYRLSCSHKLRSGVIELGLFGKRSFEKFIPDSYLHNSVEVRTALLQGLCDTDGFVESGGLEYSTASEQLANDIQFLVKSLGGKAGCKKVSAGYTKDGEFHRCRDSYRLQINFPKGGVVPVTSKKHLAKYKPCRGTLYHFINDIRETDRYADMICIEVEDERALYAITDNFILTHNTTSGLRLTTMMAGRKPDGNIFATGKGEGLVKSFFGGLNDIYETPEVYRRYLEVFPKAPKVKQNAEELTIDLAVERRFSSITCRPIDGSVVGNTEANVLLYIDDCVKNHEEARNIARLEFLCEKITDDILGRRIEGCPIIIQGTKYSLHDPITMLQDKATQLGWRWKEVAIPALDPVTDQSNWTIYSPDRKPIFTTEYYQNERNLVTAETWAAEFQQEPYEAKGRMFPEEQLNRFTNLPVDMEPDTIIAACDTAGDGSDYCSMPIAYVYGQEVYIVDVVFDDSAPTFTKAECANKLVEHNVKRVTFESNSAGGYFGRDVMELVEANGGRCSARFKYSVANKLTRMENASDNIIKYYYFLDKTCYAAGSQYDTFMKNVVRMTRSGKVSHDDGPDSLALLENEMRNTPKPATVYRHVL